MSADEQPREKMAAPAWSRNGQPAKLWAAVLAALHRSTAATTIGSQLATLPSAVGETLILLHPPLPSVGVSIRVGRGCQQNDSLADG